MCAWEPIDTAPDRDNVLVFSRSYGVVIARRSGDVWSRDLGYASEAKEAFYLDTAVEASLTHWKPLPDPPFHQSK